MPDSHEEVRAKERIRKIMTSLNPGDLIRVHIPGGISIELVDFSSGELTRAHRQAASEGMDFFVPILDVKEEAENRLYTLGLLDENGQPTSRPCTSLFSWCDKAHALVMKSRVPLYPQRAIVSIERGGATALLSQYLNQFVRH